MPMSAAMPEKSGSGVLTKSFRPASLSPTAAMSANIDSTSDAMPKPPNT